MPRIHKSYNHLLSDESPSSVSFDLVYRTEPESVWPSSTLVVDYDLSRIHATRSPHWKTCEMQDLAGPYGRLLIRVWQFDSLWQVKRDVYAASRILAHDGELRVTVPPKSGAKRITADLKQVFTRVEAFKTAGHTLLICKEPTPRDYPEADSHIDYRDDLSGKTLGFMVRPGIFSTEKIDAGTEFLLKSVPSVEGKRVLDVGCGYGAIGIVAAARGAHVLLLDVDARVVKLARHNLKSNELDGTVMLKLQPYDFPDDAFDVVLSNPPTHAGSEMLRVLFSEMVRVSSPSGYVALVVREQLNYEKWLRELGSVERLGTAHGYKILRIGKNRGRV
jgi:16S rRNA (guanine1207-N2)-methyltransferase